MEKTLELDIPLIAPDIEDVRDRCLDRLEEAVKDRRGILHAHVIRETEPPRLCLHYDPNLLSLSAARRFAHQAGADFTDRYRHETVPVDGMDTADAADYLAELLEEMPGMLHASVNYAAGLAFLAYDGRELDRPAIEEAIREVGYRPRPPTGLLPLTYEPVEPDGWLRTLLNLALRRWQVALVALAGLLILAAWLGDTFLGLPERAALAFYALAYLAGGYDVATHAIPGLFKGQFDTDVLMLAAAAGAAVLGEWPEGAFLLFLFGLGHAGEQLALDRARNAINALGQLMPKTARVRQGEAVVERPVEEVKLDQVVVVPPGDRIPVDGRVLRGQSTVDQSAITGESTPVEIGDGSKVFAGTVNLANALEVRATSLAEDNTISRIIQLVAEAQAQQSPTQRFAQRFSAVLVPSVLVLVLAVIALPPLLGWATFEQSFYRGMLLLVAASPCALAIGAPAAVLAGIAQAARNGVLIKGGVHLENLGALGAMALDKTGTLTKGVFSVTDLVPFNGRGPDELLRVAAAVEQSSNHPLAQAVLQAARDKQLDLPPTNGLENLAGRGVRSEVDGQPVLIGSPQLFQGAANYRPDGEAAQAVSELEGQGKTVMIVSHGDQTLGILALADTPRPGVRETMGQLLDLGLKHLVMLTGDNQVTARQIGREVGVTDVRAGLLPEEKLAAIKALQEEFGPMAMVGDGVNDAPALAKAAVGIAMGGAGTAVALETADVALMADDLSKLPFAVGLSRASRRIIRQNLALALGVIGLLILTSVLGLVQLSTAVVLHEGSTVLVVTNALRLLRYREDINRNKAL